MDVSKFKDALQGIFKDYTSLLLPVAIGVVGALLFIPAQLMSSRLRTQIEAESISQAKTLVSLSTNAVASSQWKQERSYQEAHARDVNEIELLAKQSTQRELLSYIMFPQPKDQSTQIFKDFGQQFRISVDGLIARINARDCPTEDELNRSLQRASSRGSGARRQSYMILDAVGASIRDDLCREKAQSASVYANPSDFGGYDFWAEFKYAEAGSRDEVIEDCWYGQLGYWVIEDVVETVRVVNLGSSSVFTSPVKRILSVSFTGDGRRSRPAAAKYSSRSGQKVANDAPAYVISVDSGLAVPCTGRVSNSDIDVVHFKVSLLVSSKVVLQFMKELCCAKQHRFKGWDGREDLPQILKHNQITILEYSTALIDPEDRAHQLYRYGDDALVQLDLICEYIFDKDGYDEIKPEAVKKSVEESLKQVQEQRARAVRRAVPTAARPAPSSTPPKRGRGRDLPDVGM